MMTLAWPPLAALLYGRHVADGTGTGYAALRYTDAAVAEPVDARISSRACGVRCLNRKSWR